jgi:hypothetical protein
MERLRAVTEDIIALRRTGSDSSVQRRRYDFLAPANWVAIIGMADPLPLADSCPDIIEAALYSGIPRRLRTLAPADGFVCLLDAVIQRLAPVEDLLELHEHREKWKKTSASTAGAIVSLGRRFEYDQITKVHQSLEGQAADTFGPWLLSIGLVRTLLDISAKSTNARHAMMVNIGEWTPQLDSFFAAVPYRGLRRRAARYGARSWARTAGGQPPTLLATAPSAAFLNAGFRGFCAEWLHAQGRGCLQASSFEAVDLSELMKIGQRLEASAQGDLNPESWCLIALQECQTKLEDGIFGEFDD